MMDPFSTVTTVVGLVGTTLKGIQTINTYHDLYARSAITIASMTAQCSCVEFALLQVQETIVNNPQSIYRLRSDSALARHFSSVFGACQLVFSILDQRLKGLLDNGLNQYGELGTMQKIKQVWNDQEMKDLLRNIESQASAINLLLGALQMRSNADIHDLLARRDSRKLLDQVSNDAISLRSAEDTKKRISDAEGLTPSLHSTFDDIEFAFDFELINTATYRKAFQCASRNNLALAQVDTTSNIVVRGSQKENMMVPIEEDLLLLSTTGDDEKMEQIVTEGAKMLVNPEPKVITSYGHFPAPPVSTQIITPKPHQFHVAEIVPAPSQSLDHALPLGDNKSTAVSDMKESMTDVIKALDNMMLSSFEDIVPQFSFEAKKPSIVFPNSEPVVNPVEIQISASLIDISVPENAQGGLMITSTTLEDLMELDPSLGVSQSLPDAADERSSPLTAVVKYVSPTPATPPENQAGRETLLHYMSHTRRFVPSFRSDLVDDTRVQQIVKISPQQDPQILYTSPGQPLFPASVPKELSLLTKYSYEHVVKSTSSSSILKGRKVGTEEVFAIKIMNRRSLLNDSLSSKDRLQSIQLEVAILHDLMHYNIIRIHELVQLEMRIVIVMSFASPITLLEYIQDKRRGAGVWTFPETMSWSIFRQLVSGVMYLHDNRTIHRNLTLDNVLFDSQKERIVIKGFNLAEIVTDGNEALKRRLPWQQKFINPYYTAPEVLADPANFQSAPSVYDAGKVDTYSCGVILFTMVNGVLPYKGNIMMTQFGRFHTTEHLHRVNATPIVQALSNHKGDENTYSLLVGLLENNPKLRYGIRQASSHPWMQVRPSDGKRKYAGQPWIF